MEAEAGRMTRSSSSTTVTGTKIAGESTITRCAPIQGTRSAMVALRIVRRNGSSAPARPAA
jgi:hypothetical protein